MDIIYFSNIADNTENFVNKLGWDLGEIHRIPKQGEFPTPPTKPYVLIIPTYGSGKPPVQVRKFLNKAVNRKMICGVVGSGNKNFGANFARASDTVARMCNIPLLGKFEMRGTDEEIKIIKRGLIEHGINYPDAQFKADEHVNIS